MNVVTFEMTTKQRSKAGHLKLPTTDTYGRTAEDFLNEYFRYSYCCECGGDAVHHTAILINGNWFVRCDFPPPANCEQHPVIAEFRADALLEESNAMLIRPDGPSSGRKHERRWSIEGHNVVFLHYFRLNHEARLYLGRCA